MEVRSFYFNFDLAERMGYSEYTEILNPEDTPGFFLEWLFAGSAWGWEAGRDEMSFQNLLLYDGGNADRADYLRALRRDVIPRFLGDCLGAIRDANPSVVGFSCLFQHMPSLALGRMISEAMPGVKLIYGGSAFHGDAGAELFDKLEWIDAVSNSEADDVAAEAFRRLLDGNPLDGLQGIMYRERASGRIYRTSGACVAPEAFDSGIVPDFDAYIDAVASHGLSRYLTDRYNPAYLPFESSRGCWWYEKSPCTFCGTNGISGTYRLKSPENVTSAIGGCRERYGVSNFVGTDNNLSMDYFDTFLPKIKDAFGTDGVHLVYYVKSGMNRRQVKTLADAGIHLVQAGIENFSNHVLKLMRKGVSGIQNVYFLKCARQYGVYTLWYCLLGTYGETRGDIGEITSLAARITHLVPPRTKNNFIKCHRYSVYWRESEKYFDEMKPAEWYRHVFPDSVDVGRVAFFHDVKWKDWDDRPDSYDALVGALESWRGSWLAGEEPRLYLTEDEDAASIVDTRSGRRVKAVLTPNEAAIYKMLDDIVPSSSVIELASGFCGREEASRTLDSFVECGFAIRDGDLYLGLALRDGFKIWSRMERLAFMRR
jgi:ribosomal peptide maturation radical SAM protein 1